MLAGIAGGKVFTGEEIREFAGEFIGGAPGSLCGRGRSRGGDDGGSGECGIGGRRQRAKIQKPR